MAPEAEPLNLIDEGSGILGTHVTWEAVEKALQEKFQTSATIGNRTTRNLADGVGFCSIIALVDANWQGENTERLPEKFVVKMPTCVNSKKMSEHIDPVDKEPIDDLMRRWQKMVKKVHNSEVIFYKYFSDNADNYDDFGLPKIYYEKPFDGDEDVVGFLIMEFLEDIHISHLYDAVPVDRIRQALKAWARIQAFTYNEDFLSRPFLKENNFRKTYEDMLSVDKMRTMLRNIAETADEKLKYLCEKTIEVAEDVYDFDGLGTECDRNGMRPLLAHGDLWSTNVLWHKTTKDLKCIIDFQIIHLGSPGEDISRLLTTCMSGAERRKHEDDLLSSYYHDFAHFLGETPMPFSLEQLRANYRSVFPIFALVNAAMFGPVLQYVTFKIADPKAKEAVKSTCNEKMVALFEDLLKRHSEK